MFGKTMLPKRNRLVAFKEPDVGSQHEMRRFSPFTDTDACTTYDICTAALNLETLRVPLTPDTFSRKYPYKDEFEPYPDGPILR